MREVPRGLQREGFGGSPLGETAHGTKLGGRFCELRFTTVRPTLWAAFVGARPEG